LRSRVHVRWALVALAACGLLISGAAVPVSAQTVTDPQIVEFDPSADHWGLDATGQAIVDHYELAIFASGSTSPYETAGLGKPTPAADGKIRVSLAAVLSTWPLPLLTYTAKVSAVGPVGSAPSAPSNTFTFSGSCSYSTSITQQTFGASGGTGTASVTAGTGCLWSAGTDVGWIAVSATGGSGTGSVGFAVSSNSSSISRTGYVNVGGQSFAVAESGVPCTYALSPSSQSFTSSGGTGSTTVTTPSGCAWTPVSSAAWLTPGAAGVGSAVATYVAAANPTTSSRSATLTIGDRVLTVTQAGTPGCTYALSPTSKNFGANGGTVAVSVTAAAGCSWTAVSNASWITALTPSGNGSARVSLTVPRNPAKAPRTGTVTIAGLTFTITEQ
jgi:hypothetical protein